MSLDLYNACCVCVLDRDKTWPRTQAPTKKKEVFKMIRSSRDMTNYTVRRLEISMKEELKKAEGVKKVIFGIS